MSHISETLKDSRALTLYSSWWAANGGKSLAVLRTEPWALEGVSSTVGWAAQSAPAPIQPGSTGEIIKIPNSDTPKKKKITIMEIIKKTTPNGTKYWELPPETPGGKMPVNCLGHVLGIAGWPFATNQCKPMPDVMTDEGYASCGSPPAFSTTDKVVCNLYYPCPKCGTYSQEAKFCAILW